MVQVKSWRVHIVTDDPIFAKAKTDFSREIRELIDWNLRSLLAIR
ncbi:MAG: hypothetical protein ACK553_15010 [Planctomycetota bacterium]|jgi:hypothetical protein